ncbi:hypothetical protein D3C73_1539280 [compost metagenome]
MRYGMRRFESRNDSLSHTQQLQCIKRLRIGNRNILGAFNILEIGMLRTNTRIVQSGRDGMRLCNLSVFILQQIA